MQFCTVNLDRVSQAEYNIIDMTSRAKKAAGYEI